MVLELLVNAVDPTLYLTYIQNPITPISPLEPGVEMFSKGRPKSIIPIDYKLAMGLSVVPELPTPQTGLLAPSDLYNPTKARPISQITEIYSLGSDSEFEEDSDEALEREFVSEQVISVAHMLMLCRKKKLREDGVRQRFPLGMKYKRLDLYVGRTFSTTG